MPAKSLLVVEDEVLVARDIVARLRRMGYEVLGTAAKGIEAIDKALQLRPDLILMDIHLADEIDGIEAAFRIRREFDVPVIFCTAYSNGDTLERAMRTTPYGYVLKPFDNRELEINIEIALYKHNVEKVLSSTQRRLEATLAGISDGVIATSREGDIRLFNPMAENITGWSGPEASSAGFSRVMQLQPLPGEAETFDLGRFACGPISSLGAISSLRQQLVHRDGQEVPVEIAVNPVETEEEDLLIVTFRDISPQLR